MAYREAHILLEELADAQLEGTRKGYMAAMAKVPLLIIDDLGVLATIQIRRILTVAVIGDLVSPALDLVTPPAKHWVDLVVPGQAEDRQGRNASWSLQARREALPRA